MRTAALLLSGCVAFAQSPDYALDTIPKLPGLLWEDTKATVSAPGDWTGSQWGKAGLCAAAVLGTALLLDRPVDDAMARSTSPSRDRLARNLAKPGGTPGLVLMGAGYVGFSLLGWEESRSVVVDMGIATVLAQAAVLPLKFAAGRSRPDEGEGAHHFVPFSSRESFPSGHTTQAFAMASALAARCDSPWVGVCAYGAAGLVGLARLEARQHFASDVVTGAILGTAIGRFVVHTNQTLRAGSRRVAISFAPDLAPGYQGVTLSARF
jgi:hypothetical protein